MSIITSAVIKKKPKLESRKYEGHEIYLSSAISKKRQIRIQLMSGAVFQGFVVLFDRYSIALRLVDGTSRTVFKHSIEFFEPVKD